MLGPALLSRHLKTNGLTLREFAWSIKASPASVLHWRRGSSVPGAKFLLKLRDEAGIPVEAWVKGRRRAA